MKLNVNLAILGAFVAWFWGATAMGQSCQLPLPPSNPFPSNSANMWSTSKVLTWTGYNSGTLLHADFEDKTANAVIGTGGAVAGEPVGLDPTVGGVVRTTPMSSKSLELVDNDNYSAAYARFEFLGSQEIVSGKVEIRASLWFDAIDSYSIFVRERGSSASNFLDLWFTPSGNVFASGATGTQGSYVPGRPYEIMVVFDMAAGTYDLIWDGQVLVKNQAHGQYGPGVGAVLFGTTHDADLSGKMYVDNISVTTSQSTVESLLNATFENQTVNSPVGTRGATFGEPAWFDASVGAFVRATPMGTKSVELVDNDDYAAAFAFFELLDHREITSGRLEIRAQLWFDAYENYLIGVRESNGATKNFFDMTISEQGYLWCPGNSAIETYQPGRTYDISIVFDLDRATYDVIWDGHLMIRDQPHGQVGRGVGSVFFGTNSDLDLSGKMYIDNVSVALSSDCGAHFNIYVRDDQDAIGTYFASDVPYVAVPALQCGDRYNWTVEEQSSAGQAQAGEWVFSTARCICDEPMLRADFDDDVIGSLPDVTLSADPPDGDYLTLFSQNGVISVVQTAGSLVDKPLLIQQIAGIGSRRVYCYPSAPVTGDAVVSWRSLARSNSTSFMGCVLRSTSGGIIASLEYRGNGLLTYNSNGNQVVVPARYTPDVDQAFEITVNFAAQTTSLYIDGRSTPDLKDIPFVHSSTGLACLGIEPGGTNEQAFAVDDVEICATPSCCKGLRGNVDCDENENVDISDLSALIGNLFIDFAPLCCEEEADLNADGNIDIGDVVSLIDYLYITFQPLAPCGGSQSAVRIVASNQISYTATHDSGVTTVCLHADRTVRGLQLTLRGTGDAPPANLCGDSINLFYGQRDKCLIVGLFDRSGRAALSAGSTPVVRLDGYYSVESGLATDLSGSVYTLSSSSLAGSSLPERFELQQNYPNPFNPLTTITFSLPSYSDVALEVFNALGQKVAKLIDGPLEAGPHSAVWDGQSDVGGMVASGVYFYKITAGNNTAVKKMIFLK